MKGKFVVHKSSRELSALAIDQAHEHANAVIKGKDGVIGVTDNPSALRRWILLVPRRAISLERTKNLRRQKWK